MMHEVTEGYQMGLISIELKRDIKEARGKKEKIVSCDAFGNITTRTLDVPIHSDDYRLFDIGHFRATRAPNEMTKKQAAGYKL
jgi:hypothetical protein